MSKVFSLRDDKSYGAWQLFKTPEAKRKLSSNFGSSFVNVLPHLNSGDPRFHGFLRDLCATLNSKYPVSIEHGFTYGSCVVSEFDSIRCLAGVKSVPTGQTMHDNILFRESLGLPNKFLSDEDISLWHELIDCMFSVAKVGNIPVAKRSTQGPFSFSYDSDKKKKDAISLFHVADEYMSLYSRGNANTAMEVGGHPLCYSVNYRLQAESPDKDRMVASLQYAASGGAEGEMLLSDKSVFGRDGVMIQDLGACRTRCVYGLSNAPNQLMNALTTSLANYYLNEFEYTWKHRSGEHVANKLESFIKAHPNGVIIGIDVTQFDRSVPRFLIDDLFEYVSDRYISSDLANFCKLSLRAPVFQGESGDGVGPVMHGDIFNTDEFLEGPGLLSGNAWVAFIGKVVNVFNLLVNIKNCGYPIKGKVFEFLKGRLDVRTCNMGDDGLVMFSDMKIKSLYDEVSKKGYLKVDNEPSLAFLGNVFTKEGSKIRSLPNIRSFLNHTLVPERGYDSKLREFWHIGISDRFKIYSGHPIFYDVLNVCDSLFKKRFPHLGLFSDFLNHLIESNRWHDPSSSVNDMDAQLYADPSIIHWKYDASMFSEEALASVVSFIEVEHFKQFIDNHFLMDISYE